MKNIAKKGFTLVELLIVVTIIGILTVALAGQIGDLPSKTRDQSRKAVIESVKKAVAEYNFENGSYPNNTACLYPASGNINTGTVVTTEDFIAEYLKGEEEKIELADTNNSEISCFLQYTVTGNDRFVGVAMEIPEDNGNSKNITDVTDVGADNVYFVSPL